MMHKRRLRVLAGLILISFIILSCMRDFNNPLDPENPNRLKPPAAPTGLRAIDSSLKTISLQWTDASDNDDGFIVERLLATTVYTTVGTVSSGATGFKDTGLLANTDYHYRVSSFNKAGKSEGAFTDAKTRKSIQVSFLDLNNPDTVYETDFNVKVKVLTTMSSVDYVSINGKQAMQSNNPEIFYYQIKLDSTDGSLNPIRVKAYASDENVDSITVLLYYVWPQTPPVPTGLTAAAQSVSMIRLGWNKAKYAVTYQIYRKKDTVESYIRDTTSTGFEDKGLEKATTYYYRIKAHNRAGTSGYSDWVSAKTQSPSLTVPARPAGLEAQAISHSKIQIQWSATATAEDYQIYRSTSADTGYLGVAVRVSPDTSYLDTGLAASTTYYYRVAARNGAGSSPQSDSVCVPTRTASQNTPFKPTGVTASALSSSVINLTWPAVEYADVYKIYRSASAQGVYVFIRQVATIGFGDSGLAPSTTYYYKIIAKNRAAINGDSPYSDSAFATTMPPALLTPSKPESIGAQPLSFDVIHISWTAVAEADSYRVYRALTGTGLYNWITTLASTNYNDSGRHESTTYYYKVKAVNRADSSAYSDSALATTPDSAVPIAPWAVGMPDTTVAINDSFFIHAQGYAPSNGGVSKYIWELGLASHSDTTSDSLKRVAFGSAGRKNVMVKIKAQDGQLSAADTIVVDVHAYPPSVAAMEDTFVASNALVTVHAAGSDTNREIALYYWDKGLNGWDDSVTSSSWQAGNGTGPVRIRVGVRDSDGFFAYDTFTVYYNRAPSSIAILAPASGTAPNGVYENADQKWRVFIRWQCVDADRPRDTLAYSAYCYPATGSRGAAFYMGRDTFATFRADTVTAYKMEIRAQDKFGDTVWSAIDSFFSPPPPFPGMVFLRGRAFQMGQAGVPGAETVHQVTLSDYYMDTTEVTQADYFSVTGQKPSLFSYNPQTPVDSVSWYDAVLYCNARSKRGSVDTVYSYTAIQGSAYAGCTGLTNLSIDKAKKGYRLPTEAEWEYACRAGTAQEYYWSGISGAIAGGYAWYSSNSGLQTHPVAGKARNAFGLFDMSGNVSELCNDYYGDYSVSDALNPRGPENGQFRVSRGGSWKDSPPLLRSADRAANYPNARYSSIGFRVVLPR